MGNTEEQRDKDSVGRGAAIIIYGLYLGAIMSVVTLPLGMLIAHYKLGRSASWIGSHLRFQIYTFWWLAGASLLALGAWQLLGLLGTNPKGAWVFGYLYITAAVVWYVARCGVGIHRLTSNLPIDKPRGLLFG